jgi:small-conductance mechanosensitive channel
MDNIFQNTENILLFIGLLAGAVILGFIAHYVVFTILRHFSERTKTTFDDYLIKHVRRPMRAVMPLLFVFFVSPILDISPDSLEILKHALSIGLIGSVAWLLIHIFFVAEDIIMSRYDLQDKDNLKARQVYTQIQVFKRVVTVVVSILAFATILMTFEKVRQLGTSILASAGVIGIVVGFAAQRTISTIFAGFQIAITQPIRMDDVVIVENEWGWIEEITLTYVVVRIWDLRRLILPITYFIERPFQNWTRITADILGTVYVYADYTIPVQEIREYLNGIVKESKFWDGKVCGLIVTNCTEKTVELRALVSARDSSDVWNLRCEVREKLVELIQKKYPYSLPKVRAELNEIGSSEKKS